MDNQVQIEPFSITFEVHENRRIVRIPKSDTKVQFLEQFNLITYDSDTLVPLEIKEEADAYIFTFTVDKQMQTWEQLEQKEPNEKLRALYNVSTLFNLMSTRITFFLHPNNLVFDHNLMPKIIFRGIYRLSTPYEVDEEDLLKQYKSLIIAMYSEEYTFDDIYKGSLEKAAQTTFLNLVKEQNSIKNVTEIVHQAYLDAQAKIEKEKQLVPIKKFTMYKHLSIWISVAAVTLLSLLIYTSLIRAPYQDKLLEASHAYLANDNSEVIQILQEESPDKLPQTTKYILASSYLAIEQLSETEKEAIMKNININSDKRYLLYWIYNGRGDFDKSLDVAKYVDDPTLIMYGLIKKTEQVKNDPALSGDERDEEVRKLRDELEKNVEEYGIELNPEDTEYNEYSEEADEESDDKEESKSVKDKDKDKEKKNKSKKK